MTFVRVIQLGRIIETANFLNERKSSFAQEPKFFVGFRFEKIIVEFSIDVDVSLFLAWIILKVKLKIVPDPRPNQGDR